MLESKWVVTEMEMTQDPVEVTSEGSWHYDDDMKVVVDTPPDKWRKFVPGVRSVTMSLAYKGTTFDQTVHVGDEVWVTHA